MKYSIQFIFSAWHQQSKFSAITRKYIPLYRLNQPEESNYYLTKLAFGRLHRQD